MYYVKIYQSFYHTSIFFFYYILEIQLKDKSFALTFEWYKLFIHKKVATQFTSSGLDNKPPNVAT